MTIGILFAALSVGLGNSDTPVFCEAVGAAESVVVSDSLKSLYEGGQNFEDFLGAATARKELWHSNYERSIRIDSQLVARVRAIPGRWRILAVAVDACSDSVNTLPYIARLVQLVDSLDLRIVNSTVGRGIMEAHPTPDGRAATPTFLLLDSNFDEVGCFIERPPVLQDWMMARKDSMSTSQLTSRKMEWYADDAGRHTLDQLADMLTAAAAGGVVCK